MVRGSDHVMMGSDDDRVMRGSDDDGDDGVVMMV